MDRYQKVENQRSEVVPINENEIRITAQGLVRNYISYATNLLHERKGKDIVLKAMGQAISKTVAIAEIIKRRVPRLHQDTAISSISITDVWEPIEEGLVRVEQTRHVSMISITLSLNVLDKNSPGYQAPANVENSKPQYNSQQQQKQPSQGRMFLNAVNEDSYGRGRGRGRGRGWNRSGYGNYQENGGYSNWNRGGGRARNYGYRGAGYGRGYGYETGPGYEGGGYGGYRRSGYEGGNGGYEEGYGGYNRRDAGYEGGSGGYKGRPGYDNRGAANERGSGNGRGRGGGRGGYGRGRGRMGGRGRGGGGGY